MELTNISDYVSFSRKLKKKGLFFKALCDFSYFIHKKVYKSTGCFDIL